MKIQNLGKLAGTDPLRLSALKIAEYGLFSIDTKEVIRKNVALFGDALTVSGETIILKPESKLFVIGIGKCSLDSASALEEILGSRIYKGIVIDVRSDDSLHRIKSTEGDHPFPSQRNVDLTHEIIQMLSEAGEDDVVLMIISGGGSTLLCQPDGFTCQDEGFVLQTLFRAGATIQEINTVRKHLSLARGGHLAEHAYPAKVQALIFSDVVGDDLEFIASGPTVMDTTTVDDAKKIFKKYDVEERSGFKEDYLMETPKDTKYFNRVVNSLLVSNKVALDGMIREAKSQGFDAKICTSALIGEATIVGEQIVKELHEAPKNSVLLYGGETTVRIKGSGRGGRNQELALSALKDIRDDEVIIALASDGRDNSSVAGAIVDGGLKNVVRKMGLNIDEYLARNDSLAFFERSGGHILTGITGSNTADFVIAVKR